MSPTDGHPAGGWLLTIRKQGPKNYTANRIRKRWTDSGYNVHLRGCHDEPDGRHRFNLLHEAGNTAEPEFLVRQREAVEADQQDDMGEDAYINVAGFKLTMDTPFTEFAEAVELYEPYEPKGDMKWQVDEIIAPQDEMTFSGRLRGYGSTSLYLRLFNPGTEAIKANDSLIIGIQIKNSYDSFARTPHHAPVSGPFNVRMGEPFKEAMDKIPDDALEKEFPEEGGAYATYDAHGMRYLAVASPEDGWSEDLNHMSLTVMR